VHPATGIAEATSIPLPTVAKVLKILSREGLLLSTRGVHGGYALARDPAMISLVDVIEAVDGPVALTACAQAGGDCADETHCELPPHWRKINGAVREALERVSILDLARPTVRPERPAAVAPLRRNP
jgi:FeS assembly SUF system regulator